MRQMIEEFLIYLKEIKKKSQNTILSYGRDLFKMVSFFEKNGITEFSKITSTNINSYVIELEKQGKSAATIARNISAINTLFKYLWGKRIIDSNPLEHIKTPKIDKGLPEILTIEEVERLLKQPNGKNKKSMRDKAMLELMYATGIRVSELINIKLEDLNMQLGYIECKNSKKNRVVPFGNKVKIALSKYINEFRVKDESEVVEWLFLNCNGKQMSRQGVWKILKKYAELAEINKDINPHTLRHTFCAHSIKKGANIKEVQEIMGHVDIASTTVYSGLTVVD